jgi:hypothetical protein
MRVFTELEFWNPRELQYARYWGQRIHWEKKGVSGFPFPVRKEIVVKERFPRWGSRGWGHRGNQGN